MNIVYTIVFFCALTALLTWIGIRNKAKGWRGVVTDIQRKTRWNNDVPQEVVVIKYRTDAGKSGKLRVDGWNYGRLYQQLVVGDRFVKVPGEPMPKRESAPAKPL